MKSRITAVMSCVILMAYMFAVVGIDVHTDDSGRHSYVVSLLRGISCDRIHPQDHCCCQHHHHDAESMHYGADGCSVGHHCTDSIDVLTITGTADETSLIIPAITMLPSLLVCGLEPGNDSASVLATCQAHHSKAPPLEPLSSLFCCFRI